MAVYGKNTKTGKWKPQNPLKYVGDVDGIVFRSSWEKRFLNWCDSRTDVLEYSSEEVIIPYFDPVKGKMRRYFVDFWLKIKGSDGVIRKFLIEIKPKIFTQPPIVPKRKTARYIEETMQWVTNQAKWEAANKVCKDSGMEFLVLTEDHIFGKAHTK